MVAIAPVLFIIGLLITLLAVAMGLPAIVDLVTGNPDWQVFAGSSAVSLFFGVALMLATRTGAHTSLNIRQAFLLTGISWLAVAVVASLPFAFSELNLSVSDAFFEAMSGITTTGSTVIVGLDTVPPGILLWRALLQWLGGVGIIVMALAMLPMLQVGGMQLFQTEAFDTPNKVLPRAAQLAGGIFAIYLLLTAGCALGLWMAGMSGFDAITHAMTTIATGGYSTRDASIGYFDNSQIEWIIIAGMIIGSLPFVYYLSAVRGDLVPMLQDSQIRWFFSIVILSALSVALWLLATGDRDGIDAFRTAAFNVISVLTGTGYSTTNFRRLGRVSRDTAAVADVRRRLRRFHHLRHQGVPVPGPVRDGRGPAPSPADPARCFHSLLQSQANPGIGVRGGDGFLFPVHRLFRCPRRRAGGAGS